MKNRNKIQINQRYLLLAITMCYMGCYLANNLMIFRSITLTTILFDGVIELNLSKVVFPLISIIICTISYISNSKISFIVILFGFFCEFLFVMSLFYVSLLSVPAHMTNNEVRIIKSVDFIANDLLNSYIYKFVPMLLMSLSSVYVFDWLSKRKVHVFFMLMITSCIATGFYNIVFGIVHHEYQQIFTDMMIEITITILYSLILITLMNSFEIIKDDVIFLK